MQARVRCVGADITRLRAHPQVNCTLALRHSNHGGNLWGLLPGRHSTQQKPYFQTHAHTPTVTPTHIYSHSHLNIQVHAHPHPYPHPHPRQLASNLPSTHQHPHTQLRPHHNPSFYPHYPPISQHIHNCAPTLTPPSTFLSHTHHRTPWRAATGDWLLWPHHSPQRRQGASRGD